VYTITCGSGGVGGSAGNGGSEISGGNGTDTEVQDPNSIVLVLATGGGGGTGGSVGGSGWGGNSIATINVNGQPGQTAVDGYPP
jgi:hypothetical protein